MSSLIPLYVPYPTFVNILNLQELPINLQVPAVIMLSIYYKSRILLKALYIYFLLGLFIIPIFYEGGSLGYIMTPNFGYLIGLIPLIIIVSNTFQKEEISISLFFIRAFKGIVLMHITGITYLILQSLLYNNTNYIFYNIGKLSLSKIPYHIIIIFPIAIILLLTKKIKFKI